MESPRYGDPYCRRATSTYQVNRGRKISGGRSDVSMSEDVLLASDSEMRTCSSKESEYGSSILLSSDSRSSMAAEEVQERSPAVSERGRQQFARGSRRARGPFRGSRASRGQPSAPSWASRAEQGFASPKSLAPPTFSYGVLASATSSGRTNTGGLRARPVTHGYQLSTPQDAGPSQKLEKGFSSFVAELTRGITPTTGGTHPWISLFSPRKINWKALDSTQVTNDLPEDKFRPVPTAGYLTRKFFRSLFPTVTPRKGRVVSIPFLEIPTIEDAISFRCATERIIRTCNERAIEAPPKPPQELRTPWNEWTSSVTPPTIPGIKPVIYQIVAIQDINVILEAKDFLVFMPDRRDLHCIILDRSAFNVISEKYGFDRKLISVRDFVWVYDLMPTRAAIDRPEETLEIARIPRIAPVDPIDSYFFRVKRFAFVTPPVWSETRYGIVFAVNRTVEGYSNSFQMAMENTHSAVTITKGLIQFDYRNIQENDILKAMCRRPCSSAVRFSEPPLDEDTKEVLFGMVQTFIPANPDDGVLPMEVHMITAEEMNWFCDRLRAFESYIQDPAGTLPLMGRAFNVASSALASYAMIGDDKRIHRVESQVDNLTEYPLRFEIRLSDMASDSGWSRHRQVRVWIEAAETYTRMTVEQVSQNRDTRELHVILRGSQWTHRTLLRVVREHGSVQGNTATLTLCVKLAKLAANVIPAYEAVTETRLLVNLHKPCVGREILDAVYGATPLRCAEAGEVDEDADLFVRNETHVSQVSFKGHPLQFTHDQLEAIAIGNTSLPIVGIQAAFGTGKTVVGAYIAALQASSGTSVIVTATTNSAVAQFVDTILNIDSFAGLAVVRYIAETIVFDVTIPSTAVDFHEVLKTLADKFGGAMGDEELAACRRFKKRRSLLDNHMRRKDRSEPLSEAEREELILAEKDVSTLIKAGGRVNVQ